jgi:hypothetical protein
MKKKDLVTRVARWALLLEEFDYVLEHRPGNSMKHCDALSRNPIVMSIKNAFLEKLSLHSGPKMKKSGQNSDFCFNGLQIHHEIRKKYWKKSQMLGVVFRGCFFTTLVNFCIFCLWIASETNKQNKDGS